jgi:hypothetical protein
MDGARIASFDCLYRRVGELTAHLGRYDMQLVAFAGMLTEEIVLKELIEKWPIESRIDVICRLLRARKCPALLQHQLLDIHHQMKPVLERQAICASHPAVITQMGFARPWDSAGSALLPKNDWFNRTEKISKDEVQRAVTSVETDILTAVKLYLSLAMLASRVQGVLLEPAAVAVS